MPRKLAHVSARKIAANSQNALKSTGPRTPQGKAHSRTNALRHGLFAMDDYIAGITHCEDPGEYQALLERLAESHQPVGGAEELEVQQIAVCWWKRSRTWRYENAEIALQLCTRHEELLKRNTLSSEDIMPVLTTLLKTAESEIESTGKISDDLNRQLFADPEFQPFWEVAEKRFKGLLGRGAPPITKAFWETHPDARAKVVLGTARSVSRGLARLRSSVDAEAAKLANNIEAIPRSEVLDRVLRADAAAERSLNQAIDRLERLQRQRKGEAVPPPVSVRLTR